jgi:hypothetical protein
MSGGSGGMSGMNHGMEAEAMAIGLLRFAYGPV